MSEATCKTCPNWSDEDCRADVLKQYTPADHWCGKHPVRVAAYEAAVKKERGNIAADALVAAVKELRDRKGQRA